MLLANANEEQLKRMSELEKYKNALRDAGFEPFQTLSDPWGIYSLNDGSYLQIRANVIKIARGIDPAGNMSFNANVNVTIGIIAPKKLRGTPAPQPPTIQDLQTRIVEDDVDFSTVSDEWQKYKLEDNTVLSLKLVPVKISRTSLFDPNGEPIYNINHQMLLKASLPDELRKKGIRVQENPAGSHPTFIT